MVEDWRALPRARSSEKGSGISNTPCIRFTTILYIYIVGKVSFSRLQVLTAGRKILEGTNLQNAKYMRITKLKHFGSEPPLLGFLFLLLETLYIRIHHSVNRLYVVTSSLYKRPTTVPDHFCGPAPLPYTPNCCILLLSLSKCNFSSYSFFVDIAGTKQCIHHFQPSGLNLWIRVLQKKKKKRKTTIILNS